MLLWDQGDERGDNKLKYDENTIWKPMTLLTDGFLFLFFFNVCSL